MTGSGQTRGSMSMPGAKDDVARVIELDTVIRMKGPQFPTGTYLVGKEHLR
jgi:hypothetical protein